MALVREPDDEGAQVGLDPGGVGLQQVEGVGRGVVEAVPGGAVEQHLAHRRSAEAGSLASCARTDGFVGSSKQLRRRSTTKGRTTLP